MTNEMTRPKPADEDMQRSDRVAEVKRQYTGEHGYAYEARAMPSVIERMLTVLAEKEEEDAELFDGMG